MITEDTKKADEPLMDEPEYEDDTLGATMMEMDVAKIKKDVVSPPKKESDDKEESVDALLKKQNSIVGRLGSIFGKK